MADDRLLGPNRDRGSLVIDAGKFVCRGSIRYRLFADAQLLGELIGDVGRSLIQLAADRVENLVNGVTSVNGCTLLITGLVKLKGDEVMPPYLGKQLSESDGLGFSPAR